MIYVFKIDGNHPLIETSWMPNAFGILSHLTPKYISPIKSRDGWINPIPFLSGGLFKKNIDAICCIAYHIIIEKIVVFGMMHRQPWPNP